MIVNNNLSLQCFVMSDGFQNNKDLASLESVYSIQDLECVLTSREENINTLHRVRAEAGLAEANVEIVPTCSSLVEPSPGDSDKGVLFYLDDHLVESLPKFTKIALGGTFDRIHNGHKKLLTLAACVATEKVIVGVTSDDMLKAKKNAAMIANNEMRMKNVSDFLCAVTDISKCDIVIITNPYGPTIDDPSIEAIIVSSETIAGALKINKIRREKGFEPLSILVSRRSNAATLSSTFIRSKQEEKS
jgi:cytidyltransferase-like protein